VTVEEKIIELKNLTKSYDHFTAVDHLNLSVSKGEIFGLLGPNGAGKSTTILMMLGLSEPTSGSISICGYDPRRNPIEVKRKIGYLPENVGFYNDRTGLENIILTAQLNGYPYREAVEKSIETLQKAGLTDDIDQKIKTYSRGMRQRLGLADVLIKDPEVIILDEPTLGVDPNGVQEFLDSIVELSRKNGITVLLSSHDLHEVQKVCDRVGLIVGGKLIARGNLNELSQQLFHTAAYQIIAEIRWPGNDDPVEKMKAIFRDIRGVINIEKEKNNTYLFDCETEMSSDIARLVVTSGGNLVSLTQKKYGLDEIYYRYFEGGLNHGK